MPGHRGLGFAFSIPCNGFSNRETRNNHVAIFLCLRIGNRTGQKIVSVCRMGRVSKRENQRG